MQDAGTMASQLKRTQFSTSRHLCYLSFALRLVGAKDPIQGLSNLVASAVRCSTEGRESNYTYWCTISIVLSSFNPRPVVPWSPEFRPMKSQYHQWLQERASFSAFFAFHSISSKRWPLPCLEVLKVAGFSTQSVVPLEDFFSKEKPTLSEMSRGKRK